MGKMVTQEMVTQWEIYLPYFKESEFKCKCGKCHSARIATELLDKLLKARISANIPFVISSGCRCVDSNKLAGGADNSDHLAYNDTASQTLCVGVDIVTSDDRSRFIIIESLLKAGFNRFVIYKDKKILHAGIDTRNPGRIFQIR